MLYYMTDIHIFKDSWCKYIAMSYLQSSVIKFITVVK